MVDKRQVIPWGFQTHSPEMSEMAIPVIPPAIAASISRNDRNGITHSCHSVRPGQSKPPGEPILTGITRIVCKTEEKLVKFSNVLRVNPEF